MDGAVPLDEVVAPAPVPPGARVAVVSPSAGLPPVFPHVHELGLRRRWAPPPGYLRGAVLFVETSDEAPPAEVRVPHPAQHG